MAIKVYKSTDRVKLRIGEAVFHVSPLTKDQKTKIISTTSLKGGESIANLTEATAKLIKFTIKDVEGMEFADGSKYELRFKGDILEDSCVDELLNIEISDKLVASCYNLLQGIPKKLIDQNTGAELEGVEILHEGNSEKK